MNNERFEKGEIVYVKTHHIMDNYYILHSGYFVVYHHSTNNNLYALWAYPNSTYVNYGAEAQYMRKITEFERIMLDVGRVYTR